MKSILLNFILNTIPKQSRVLDLGCGDGDILEQLFRNKRCTGYGIEWDTENIQKCVEKKIPVLQINLEEGLALFENNAFDWVLQINTLQNLRNIETMLKETARVGKRSIIAFPNFAHWPNRVSVVKGRMPVTKVLPYEWYDTPNIRVGTFRDFEMLAKKHGLLIKQKFGINQKKIVHFLPNLRAATAIFVLEKNE